MANETTKHLFDVDARLMANDKSVPGVIQGDLHSAIFKADGGNFSVEGKITIVPATVDGGQSARQTVFTPADSTLKPIIISEDLNHSTWRKPRNS